MSAYDGGIIVYIDGLTVGRDRTIAAVDDDGVVRTGEYNGAFCCIRV
jgi:hypothetical protein